MAPALLAFNWSLSSLGDWTPLAGKLGWLAAFVYVACAALRLARFNTQADIADKGFFQGLASPAAAGTLACTIWFFADQGIDGASVSWLIWVETVILGLLMFSKVRYVSGKTWPRGDRIPAGWMIVIVLFIVLLAIDPPTMMMLGGVSYVISGIVITFLGRRQWRLRRLKRMRAKQQGANNQSAEDHNEKDSQE